MSPAPITQAPHELQARPRLVDRADLDVDHAGREPDAADDVLGQIGRDARSLLWPRDPDHAIVDQFWLEPGEHGGKDALGFRERERAVEARDARQTLEFGCASE